MIYELDGKKPKMRDENYWIASNATVIGDVFLDTDASIWFNCVVRGDNEPCLLYTSPSPRDRG